MSTSQTRSAASLIASLTAALALASLLAATTSAAAEVALPDAHAIYEARCLTCHNEHGADLARLRLRLEGDKLVVARTGRDVASCFRNHHGVTLAPAEAEALGALFRLGLTTGGAFQRRCAGCHEAAVSFARRTLAVRNGEVIVKSDGRPVSQLLAGGHGKATTEEIAQLLRALAAHLATTGTR